jgi:hypothetical protein
MIDQRLNALDEAHCVREFGMAIERPTRNGSPPVFPVDVQYGP